MIMRLGVRLALLFGMFAATSPAMALTGYSEDFMTLLDIDAEIVRGWLPEDLTIDTEEDTHKVWMNIGKQQGVGGLPPFLEMSVKIPNVRFRNAEETVAQRYAYYKVLYMNSYPAVYWGIILYDSPKVYADMEFTEDTVTIMDKDSGDVTYKLTYQPSAARQVAADHPNVMEFNDHIRMPRITYKNGRYKCWNTEGRGEVELIPYKTEIMIYPGFLPELDGHTQSFDGIDMQSLGTYMEKSRWRFFRVDC